MITLSINHREVTVPRGNTLLEAAEKAGVSSPPCATTSGSPLTGPAVCASWRTGKDRGP